MIDWKWAMLLHDKQYFFEETYHEDQVYIIEAIEAEEIIRE